jgi:hypothetical protein
MENADAVEADMGLQTAGAIKFCFRKLVRADVRTRKRMDPALLAETPVKRRRYKNDLLVVFDIEELAITAGEDVAFTVAIVRCDSGAFNGPPEEGGFLFRLTIGLRNIDGDWRIAHEHHSVPSAD